MGTKVRSDNPYSNKRTLPVGEGWNLTEEDAKIISPIKKHAQLEFGEMEFLFELPSLVGGGEYANLGDGRGGSAALMALGMKHKNINGHVHTIDTYMDGINSKERARARAKNNKDKFQEWGVGNYITQYMATTADAWRKFEDEVMRFKVVFIDAAHDYESVKSDLMYYICLMDSPGCILFHDTNQDDVNKVIEELVTPNPGLELFHWVNRIKAYTVV